MSDQGGKRISPEEAGAILRSRGIDPDTGQPMSQGGGQPQATPMFPMDNDKYEGFHPWPTREGLEKAGEFAPGLAATGASLGALAITRNPAVAARIGQGTYRAATVAAAAAGTASGATSAILQKYSRGEVHWTRVAIDALIDGTSELLGPLFGSVKKGRDLLRARILGRAKVGAEASEQVYRQFAKRIEADLLEKYPGDEMLVRRFVDNFAYSASQISDSEILSFLEQYAEGSIFTGKGLARLKGMQEFTNTRIAHLVATEIAPLFDAGTVGRHISDRLSAGVQIGRRQLDFSYQKVGERFRTAVAQRPIGPVATRGPLSPTVPSVRSGGGKPTKFRGTSIPTDTPPTSSIDYTPAQRGVTGSKISGTFPTETPPSSTVNYTPRQQGSVPGPFSEKVPTPDGGGKLGQAQVGGFTEPGPAPTRGVTYNPVAGGQIGMIDLSGSKSLLGRRRRAIAELRAAAKSGPLDPPFPDPEGVQRVVRILDDLPEGRVSFDTVKEIRSDLIDLINAQSIVDSTGHVVTQRPRFVAAATEVKEFLTARMYAAADEIDQAYDANRAVLKRLQDEGKLPSWAIVPEARVSTRELLESTEEYARHFYEETNGAIVRGLIKGADDKLAGPQVLRAFVEGQNPEKITYLLKRLGPNSKEADLVRSWHVHSLFQKHQGNITGLRTELFGPGAKFGDESLRALHGPKHIARYREVLDALEFAQKGSSEGKFVPRLVEAGQLGGIGLLMPATLFGRAPAGALVGALGTGSMYFVGVRALSRWITDPQLSRDLITLAKSGRTLPLTPPSRTLTEAAKAGARLVNSLSRDDYIALPEKPTPAQYRQIDARARELSR